MTRSMSPPVNESLVSGLALAQVDGVLLRDKVELVRRYGT